MLCARSTLRNGPNVLWQTMRAGNIIEVDSCGTGSRRTESWAAMRPERLTRLFQIGLAASGNLGMARKAFRADYAGAGRQAFHEIPDRPTLTFRRHMPDIGSTLPSIQFFSAFYAHARRITFQAAGAPGTRWRRRIAG